MTILAEAIATDLMAQNMLDVPVLVAAKVISGTLDRAYKDRERAIQEAVRSRDKEWYQSLGIELTEQTCNSIEGPVALDSLIEAAIEAGRRYQIDYACGSGKGYPTPASIREGRRGQDG